VPCGVVARTVEEVAETAAAWGGRAMLKAQVMSGGRGKAGGVCEASSVQEAAAAAKRILSMTLQGFAVHGVLVEEKLNIRHEYYAAITVDRADKAVILMLSAAGGMDIEEVARKKQEKIRRLILFGAKGRTPKMDLENWLGKTFADESVRQLATAVVEDLYRLFREKDCLLAEINPLAWTMEGRLVAADAKIVFDDNGLPKHPDIEKMLSAEDDTPEEREAREAGLSFVGLSGQIGCMVNGAGLAMATMDNIKLTGGTPANFLDVGGSSNPEKILKGMQILLKNKLLKAILINIFGGITRCDDVAEGIVRAKEQLGMTTPMVIRLVGTNEERGRAILSEAGLTAARGMTEAIEEVVRRARGGLYR
jgi:succinyl-CoA synthetase beta subunit